MSSVEKPIAASALHPSTILTVFAATLFVSATLLFSVQPLFTKMVLPLLGGSPGVWSVAMVFFQGVLLLGYAYAHLITRLMDPRRAVILHLLVAGCALLSLPLAIASGWGKAPAEYEAFWLIGLFAASIGLPFFAVAANAPLLQAWFARTGHPQAKDPYFLYGASNLGSFFALLAYPVVLEPLLTLRDQSWLWSAGFLLLMLMIGASGALLAATIRPVAARSSKRAKAVTWNNRAAWIGLAFVPSALLLAVTSHISTDIAAAPLLWVVPLALFLLTFVLTFRSGGDALYEKLVRFQPILIGPVVIGLILGESGFWMIAIVVNLAAFVISTMICHRRLYLLRPSAGNLTEFYMWISVGGVLGGIFSGLIAPYIFPDVWEYPILLVLALLCRPGMFDIGRRRWLVEGGVIALALALCLIPRYAFGLKLPAEINTVWMIALILLVGVMMLQAAHPARLVGLTAAVVILSGAYQPGVAQMESARSFFGVHKVVESYDGRFRKLQHGTTVHGAQKIRDEAGRPVTGRPEPLTYFHPRSPLARRLPPSGPQEATSSASGWSGSAPAASPVTQGPAKTGPSSRSIRWWCALRGIRPSSGSCPIARRRPRSCWAMRA